MVVLGDGRFLVSEVPLCTHSIEAIEAALRKAPPQTPTPKSWTIDPAQKFPGGLVFKAHRVLCHSTVGLTVSEDKKKIHPAR